jgi:hypothetical protein
MPRRLAPPRIPLQWQSQEHNFQGPHSTAPSQAPSKRPPPSARKRSHAAGRRSALALNPRALRKLREPCSDDFFQAEIALALWRARPGAVLGFGFRRALGAADRGLRSNRGHRCALLSARCTATAALISKSRTGACSSSPIRFGVAFAALSPASKAAHDRR